MLVWAERAQPFRISALMCQTWGLENEADLNGDHVEKFRASEQFLELMGMGQAALFTSW